jgi:putative nucleotidyltransferase with HDIG domain
MMTNKKKELLKQILFKAFKNSFESGGGKEYRYYHGIHVANLSWQIIKKEKLKVDRDLVYIAALFHDIGKVEAIDKNGKIDYASKANLYHDRIGSDYLSKYIGHLIVLEDIDKIIKIIRESHSNSASTECKILRDADELSNTGYMQIWRTVNDAAFTGKNIEQAIKYWESVGLKNLEKAVNNMFYGYSKLLAKEKLIIFKKFINSLKKELSL